MKKIIIAIFALCILNSCDKDFLDVSSDETNSSEMKRTNPKTDGVTVPFKSDFFTQNDEDPVIEEYPDRPLDCISPQGPWHQMGGGEATHLGKFTTKMNFCMDDQFSPSGGPGEDDNGTWDAVYNYNGVEGSFIAANGDELYFEVPVGKVRLNYLGYVFWWNDAFEFTGGTGRFEGATGEGTTNSFSTDGAIHQHHWSGKITLMK